MVWRVEQKCWGEANEGHGHRERKGDEHEKNLVSTPSSDVLKNLRTVQCSQILSEPEQVLINSTYVVEVLDDLFSLISFIIIPHLDLGLHWRRLLGQLNLFCRQLCL